MDFLSTFLSLSGMNMNTVVQVSYIGIMIWLLVIYIPKKEKAQASEREMRDDKFLETILSYKDALEDFQHKESESHAHIVNMISEHDRLSREGHKQVIRILKALADKLDAKLYED